MPAGRSPGLKRRLIAASAALCVLVATAFALLSVAIDDLRAAERRATHAQDVLIAANELERPVLDLETGLRGYLLTKDARFLGPFESARRGFPGRAAALARLVAGDPGQERRVAHVVAIERDYVDGYALPLIAAARADGPSAAGTVAETGRQRVAAMRSSFDALMSAERRRSAASSASARAASRHASVVAIAGIGVSLVLIAVYAAYVNRAIVSPIRGAATMAGRVAGGQLTARMPEAGPGEVGTLQRTFNVMAGSLQRSRDQLQRVAREQAALRRVATLVARTAPPGAVFAAVVDELRALLDADVAVVGRFDADDAVTVVGSSGTGAGRMRVGDRIALQGDDVMAQVARTASPARRVRDGRSAPAGCAAMPPMPAAAAAPIHLAGRVWGAIAVGAGDAARLPPGTEERLADFTDLAATAIANADSRAQLTASRARIVATADETRRRIERDLHDGAQQRLLTLALQLRGAAAAIPPGAEPTRAELDDIASGMTEVLDDLREMARGIHPAILADGGIAPAIRTLARRSAVPVQVDVRVGARLPEPIEVAAYYVVSEALANVAKHARASSADVQVRLAGGALRVAVRDDGIGGADFSRGSGLVGLRDRVEALGGRIAVEAPEGGGTLVEVVLPVTSAAASPAELAAPPAEPV